MAGREARQALWSLSSGVSAGAQVGTVSATTQPFLTGIAVSSGNCTVWPKYGCSCSIGPAAITRE